MNYWMLMLVFSAPTISSAAETEWLVAPYFWPPDITLGQLSDGAGGGDTVSGSDLLDKIDAAGMIRVEAARDRWGVTLDYIFLALSDEATASLPAPPMPNVNVRADVDVSVLELGAFFSPAKTGIDVDYIVGFRRIRLEKTLLVTPTIGPTQRFDGDSDFTDFFVGARYLHRFNENWDLTLRVDFGFGDSEGTTNLLGSVGYRFPGPFALQLGYRNFDLKFKENVNGATEIIDLELSGPYLGFVFRF